MFLPSRSLSEQHSGTRSSCDQTAGQCSSGFPFLRWLPKNTSRLRSNEHDSQRASSVVSEGQHNRTSPVHQRHIRSRRLARQQKQTADGSVVTILFATDPSRKARDHALYAKAESINGRTSRSPSRLGGHSADTRVPGARSACPATVRSGRCVVARGHGGFAGAGVSRGEHVAPRPARKRRPC